MLKDLKPYFNFIINFSIKVLNYNMRSGDSKSKKSNDNFTRKICFADFRDFNRQGLPVYYYPWSAYLVAQPEHQDNQSLFRQHYIRSFDLKQRLY